MEKYLDFIRNCYLFNDVAGKSKPKAKRDLRNQIKLIEEELKETKKAVMQNDMEKALDGVVDVLVTAFGLAQQLENLGCDVAGAALATSDNNLTKYMPDGPDLPRRIAEETMYFKNQGINVKHYISPVSGVVVFKDENDKIRKPSFYVSNDLKAFIPDVKIKLK